MAIWQDSNGGLHDDMGGAALALPTWPQGMTLLTDAQVAAIRAAQAPAPAPLICTPFQIRAALTQQGLRAQVEAAVSASTDQTIKDAWQYAQQFVENDTFITQMAAALGKSPADIHALFQLAVTLAP